VERSSSRRRTLIALSDPEARGTWRVVARPLQRYDSGAVVSFLCLANCLVTLAHRPTRNPRIVVRAAFAGLPADPLVLGGEAETLPSPARDEGAPTAPVAAIALEPPGVATSRSPWRCSGRCPSKSPAAAV
jgi:hypothetical protein